MYNKINLNYLTFLFLIKPSFRHYPQTRYYLFSVFYEIVEKKMCRLLLLSTECHIIIVFCSEEKLSNEAFTPKPGVIKFYVKGTVLEQRTFHLITFIAGKSANGGKKKPEARLIRRSRLYTGRTVIPICFPFPQSGEASAQLKFLTLPRHGRS